MKTKRIQWLDFARGIAIFLVVIMHSIANTPNTNNLVHILFVLIDNTLAIFAMPLFFVISGYLYKQTNTKHKFYVMLYKKITSFVFPYILFTIIAIFIHLNGPYSPYHYIFFPLDYLWFLYTLFFIFIIFGLMDLLHVKILMQFIISIITLIISLNLPTYFSVKNCVNPIKSVFGFMIFFNLGFLMRRYHFPKLIKKNYLYLLILIWMLLIIIHFVIFRGYNTNFVYYNDVITKLLSIPILFELFARNPHNSIFKYFDKYGKASLVIYLWQSPFTSIIGSHVFYKLFNNSYLLSNGILSIILFIIMVVSCWYLCTFSCYFLRFNLIKYLFYPRKYIDKFVLNTKWGKKLLDK